MSLFDRFRKKKLEVPEFLKLVAFDETGEPYAVKKKILSKTREMNDSFNSLLVIFTFLDSLNKEKNQELESVVTGAGEIGRYIETRIAVYSQNHKNKTAHPIFPYIGLRKYYSRKDIPHHNFETEKEIKEWIQQQKNTHITRDLMMSAWQIRYEPNPENLREASRNRVYFKLIYPKFS